MRPVQLRWMLVLLVYGALFCFVALAGSAGWLVLEDPDSAWQIAALALAALTLPLILGLTASRRMERAIAALENQAAELARTVDVLNAREAALRAADRTKDDFIATLGHELRNPLAALAAAAHVLGKSPKDAAGRHAAGAVARQVQHMARLIEDLLDMTRIARGKASLSRAPLELARAVENVVAELRLAGQLDHHDLHFMLSEVWVRADEARVGQIVANLLGNAVKYTPHGGRIVVSLRRDRDAAILRIHDSGTGLSPELAPRVFDLFVQGDRGRGGLGIGLALVKHLAELHGGKAFAASIGPGKGSVFTVTLPAIERHLETAGADEAAIEKSGHHRVLLIEDNEDARKTLSSALIADGHDVYEAGDGTSGLRAAADVHPDVAIIDLQLPDLDGYQVASKLRGSTAPGTLALIALTGYGQPDSQRRAREAGFDEYVTKPIAPDRLARLMDVAAARARRGARPSA